MRVRNALAGLEGSDELSSANRWSDLRRNYALAYRMVGLNSKSLCTVQADPYELRQASFTGMPLRSDRGQRGFMRVEWNPSALGPLSKSRLSMLLETIVPGYSAQLFLSTARVTRIDLSFDIYNVHPDSFLVFTPPLRKTVSVRYAYGGEGGCNAIQIGSSTSDRQLLIYDKRLQLDLQSRARTVPLLRRSRTRFELRLQASSLQALMTGPNPFAQYVVVPKALMSTQGFKLHEVDFFLDSCIQRGAQAALSRIEDIRLRRKYAEALRAIPSPNWWQPSITWAQLPRALADATPGQ